MYKWRWKVGVVTKRQLKKGHHFAEGDAMTKKVVGFMREK